MYEFKGGSFMAIKSSHIFPKKSFFPRKISFWRLKGAFLIGEPFRPRKSKKRPIFYLGLTGFVKKAPFDDFKAK